MKKFLALVAVVLLSAPSFAQFGSGGFSLSEDNLYYGIRFGVTSASFSGDIDTGLRTGMTLAGVVGFKVSNSAPLFLESGVYYTERGGKQSGETLSYNNLEVPLLVKYGIESSTSDLVFLPFLGPTFGYAIKSEDGLTRANMGFKLGCAVEYNQLYLELGRHFGVTDIVKHSPSGHSNAWFLNFGINF